MGALVVMNDTLAAVRTLVGKGDVVVSEHGYDELAADSLSVREIIQGITDALLLEDYPDYPKGPCVLTLQRDGEGRPIHVVWGIPAGKSSPAVVVTAYRPDPALWTEGFVRRRR
jgi:hypothetical protein